MNVCLCGKKIYPMKKDALTAKNIRTQGRQRQRRHRPQYLRAYECPDGAGWHLTHTTQGFKK